MHCTTLGGDWNQIHADWCGYAQAGHRTGQPRRDWFDQHRLRSDACPPRAEVAATGGDARPRNRRRGSALAGADGHAADGAAEGAFETVRVDLDPLPTRAQWDERATKPGIVGYHARKNLARRGIAVRVADWAALQLQSWTFGSQLRDGFPARRSGDRLSASLDRSASSTARGCGSTATRTMCQATSPRGASGGRRLRGRSPPGTTTGQPGWPRATRTAL